MDRTVENRYDQMSFRYQDLLRDSKYYTYISTKFCSRVTGRILDAGCGNGHITSFLAAKNPNITGVDISAGMLREAKKKFPQIIFRKMDMRSLRFRNASFEGIFCFQAFEHIPPEDQDKVLLEFSRVLRPNGTLMFNTNNFFYPKRFLLALAHKVYNPSFRLGEISKGGQTKTYRYLSTCSELRQKLNKTGFEIIEGEYSTFSKWIQI